MTREEYIDFANALKNNYTIDFDKLPEFCDLVISALSEEDNTMEWIGIYDRTEVGGNIIARLCGFECSKCNEQADHMYGFCPRCGRKAVSE